MTDIPLALSLSLSLSPSNCFSRHIVNYLNTEDNVDFFVVVRTHHKGRFSLLGMHDCAHCSGQRCPVPLLYASYRKCWPSLVGRISPRSQHDCFHDDFRDHLLTPLLSCSQHHR